MTRFLELWAALWLIGKAARQPAWWWWRIGVGLAFVFALAPVLHTHADALLHPIFALLGPVSPELLLLPPLIYLLLHILVFGIDRPPGR